MSTGKDQSNGNFLKTGFRGLTKRLVSLVSHPSEQWEIVVDDHSEVMGIFVRPFILMNHAISRSEPHAFKGVPFRPPLKV